VIPVYDPILATARTDWDKSLNLQLTIVPSNASLAMRTKCWLEWNAIRACNANYGDTGWGGLASIQIDAEGHITAAAAAVNDFYLTGLTATEVKQWRQLILCQEIGHGFGLAHQDENPNNANLNTCMDYTNLPASNQHPNAHDYAQLKTIYTHSHDPGSIAQIGPDEKVGKRTGASIPNVKRETKQDRQAQTEDSRGAQAKRGPTVIKQKLPNGDTLVTYVDWAPPELVAAGPRRR